VERVLTRWLISVGHGVILGERCSSVVAATMLSSGGIEVKVKVKCTLIRALMLGTGRTSLRGSRCVALLFHDRGTRRE
jgi:hypothetical protein